MEDSNLPGFIRVRRGRYTRDVVHEGVVHRGMVSSGMCFTRSCKPQGNVVHRGMWSMGKCGSQRDVVHRGMRCTGAYGSLEEDNLYFSACHLNFNLPLATRKSPGCAQT